MKQTGKRGRDAEVAASANSSNVRSSSRLASVSSNTPTRNTSAASSSSSSSSSSSVDLTDNSTSRYVDDNGASLPGRTFRRVTSELPPRCTVEPRPPPPTATAGSSAPASSSKTSQTQNDDEGERFSVTSNWKHWDSVSPERQQQIVKAVTRLFLFKAGRKEAVDRNEVATCLQQLDEQSDYRKHAAVAMDLASKQLQSLFDLRIVAWNSVTGTKAKGFSNPVLGTVHYHLFIPFVGVLFRVVVFSHLLVT